MEAFWSHWGWPAATAVLGFVFTALVFKQWLQRRKHHQLAWSVGLLFYSVAAVMESVSGLAGHWQPEVYRVYIVLAASLVGFLGLGTLYLMSRKPFWGHVYLAFNLVCLALFFFGTFTLPEVNTAAEAKELGRSALILEYLEKPGITVGGDALGESISFPRVMSLPFNIPGTIFLLGGALLSVWRFSAKKEYAYRMWANVLIAAGTLLIAIMGGMARGGQTTGLYPGEMVASALLLAGFLMAGTLEKGVKAIKERRSAAQGAA